MTPDQVKGAHGTCDTMKVRTVDGDVVTINVEDFDSTKHEKVDAAPKAAEKSRK